MVFAKGPGVREVDGAEVEHVCGVDKGEDGVEYCWE